MRENEQGNQALAAFPPISERPINTPEQGAGQSGAELAALEVLGLELPLPAFPGSEALEPELPELDDDASAQLALPPALRSAS